MKFNKKHEKANGNASSERCIHAAKNMYNKIDYAMCAGFDRIMQQNYSSSNR